MIHIAWGEFDRLVRGFGPSALVQLLLEGVDRGVERNLGCELNDGEVPRLACELAVSGCAMIIDDGSLVEHVVKISMKCRVESL